MHIPVLLNEAIKLLNPKQGEFFIDGTFGNGGHSKEILNKIGNHGELLALDWDEKAILKGREELAKLKNIIFINDSYANLPKILKERKLPKADGLILDLGFSSEQIENSGRGFSFQKDEPLLMNYSQKSTPVNQLLKGMPEEKLAEIILKFGEERYAKQIANAIFLRERRSPIQTSRELAEIIKTAVPRDYEHGRINPATRTFQALRIFTNHELENLENLLKSLKNILNVGGRVAIISFHSLEDRLVKNYFRDSARKEELEILTKKPVVASQN